MSKLGHAGWHGCRPWCICSSWRIWRRISWRLPKRASSCNLLQVWWSQPLCSRLSSAGHEVLCLWKASKLNMLSNKLLNEMTNEHRAIFLGIVLRLMVAPSTPLGRCATNAVKLDISLATVPLRKSTDRRGPRPPSSLSHKSHRLPPQQPSHRYSGRSSTQVTSPIGSL